MKIFIRLVTLLAIFALGWWLWTVLFPSDETAIKKRLNRVAALMTFDSKEGGIAIAANVSELMGLFELEVEVEIDTPEFQRQSLVGRDMIRNAALAARQSYSPLEVKFLDQNVAITPDGTNATVHLTGQVRQPGKRDLFVQELKFMLRKVNGKWIIHRVETVRTLT
jgi:hypothetical protein